MNFVNNDKKEKDIDNEFPEEINYLKQLTLYHKKETNKLKKQMRKIFSRFRF